jgi:hypothetical protein
MDASDLANLLSDVIAQLDTELMSADLNSQPEKWQQVKAKRDELDEDQKAVVGKSIAEDDEAFTVLTNEIQASTKALNQVIGDITKIDTTIHLITEIAGNVDQVLRMF